MNTGELSGLFSFTVSHIKAELIILEFLNVHCASCQAQTPVMNKVYELINENDHLREKVKIMGVCPGNNFREISKFKKEKAIQFPCIPDTDFEAYETVGECGTPFFIMVRKSKNKDIVTWSHRGQISSPYYFVQEAWDSLKADQQSIAQKSREKGSLKVITEKPGPFISDEEMEKKIYAAMESRRLQLDELKKISLGNGKEIYMGKVKTDDSTKLYFSKLISRPSVCDLCHAVHFILTFDEQGFVVNFIPIHLTKFENVEWEIAEIMKTRKKLVGKSILKPIPFDPEVDAVSLATMTSALIFNSVERAERDYRELRRQGYIP